MINKKDDRDILLKNALIKIKELKNKVETNKEPIAIIGMACRFPSGVSNLEAFWDIIKFGKCVIREKTNERWKDYNKDILDNPYVQKAGFLDDSFDSFDCNLFKISPVEVLHMDPQQRLFMKVSWEAFENAGYAPDSLKGSQTGVFGGISSIYENKEFKTNEEKDNPLDVTGSCFSFLTGRVSHYFGLHGPSITLDTACSSSLVSVYEACLSLQNKDCDMALAGGVNVLSSPLQTIQLSNLNILSKDCELRTFDDNANGTVRGEGCGIVVLKRLSDAKKDKDNILAIIKGGSINQDGPSSSLTAPLGIAQEKLLKQAWSKSNISDNDLTYIETHGTGTKLGDPIEITSINNSISKLRTKPLYIGAVKTNIGHLESAAGIAALMKVVLMIQNKTIPKNSNFITPSSYFDWENSLIKVPEYTFKYDDKDRKMICGVSAFGLSGTNVHMVVTEPDILENYDKNEEKNYKKALKFSATSPKTLKLQLENMLTYLKDKEKDNFYDIASSYNISKANLSNKLSVFASNVSEAKDNIQRALNGEESRDIVWSSKGNKKCVFVFTGQGSQYSHMFEQMYYNNATFKKYIDICDKYYNSLEEKSLIDIIFSDDKSINETAYTQPALFSVEYASAKMLMDYGVKPDILLGHSVGEFVAACISGVFSIKDALKLLIARGNLMQHETINGEMLAIYTNRDEVSKLIKNNKELSIAASNTDSQTVVSGKSEDINNIKNICEEMDIKYAKLHVNKAFHSYLMESMIDKFKQVAKSVQYNKSKYKIISNITANFYDKIMDCEYWCEHVLSEVKFCDSIKCIPNKENYICIEMGPQPVLNSFINQITNGEMNCTYINARKEDELETQDRCLIDLYSNGINIIWDKYYEDKSFNFVTTPNYVFDENSFNNDIVEDEVFVKKNIVLKDKDDCKNYIVNLLVSGLRINREDIEDRTNLLFLGANSIMIGRMLDTLRKKLHIKLEIKKFIQNCTVLDWTNLVWEQYKNADGIDKKDDFISYKLLENEKFNLSDVQYAYWIGRNPEMEWGNVGCCAYLEFDIDNLDIIKFKKVVNSVIKRHNMLRCIITEDGHQQILEEIDNPLIIYDKDNIMDLDEHLLNIRDEMKYQKLPLGKPMFDIRASENKQSWRIHFTIDFLISDAMSLFIFWNDINKLYSGIKLKPLEITYKDYLYHMDNYLDTNKYNTDKQYWIDRVNNFPKSPQLPYKNSNISYNSDRKFIRKKEIIDKETWNKFKKNAATHNLTASAALLSLYSEVLSAWGGGKHFAIMLTVFKREQIHNQVNEIIGDFTKLMLVEIKREDKSFVENAKCIQEQLQSDLEHESYSAIEFVKELNRKKSEDNTYPVVFTSAIGIDEINDNIFLESMESILSSTPQVFLDHQVYLEQNGVAISWDIMDEIFPENVSSSMYQSYIKLIKDASEDSSFWNTKAVDLRTNEQKIVHKKVNSTEIVYPSSLLHEGFNKNAINNPDSIAIICENKEYTYKELQTLANSMSVKLLDCGISMGDKVVIQMKKSYEQIAAVISVIQIGAVYVPVYYDQPVNRTKIIIDKCSAKCIMLDRKNTDNFKGVLQLSKEDFNINTNNLVNMSSIPYDSQAYIIYTSGSSGSPKGVCITHNAVMNTIIDVNEKNKISNKDRVLCISSLSFDLSVYDIFGVLSVGGTLVIPTEDERIDTRCWYELIKKYQITLWNSVPAILNILVDYIDKNMDDVEINSLKNVFLSGDWIPLNLYERTLKVFPNTRFISMGGATEASIWSNYYEVNNIESDWKSIPYGYPLANQQFYILDNFDRCCPDEVEGKLFISGEGLAQGYYNEIELTNNAFFYSETLKERLYYTGDYGKYKSNGVIEFLGRKDNQIKINGYRIEKGDILIAFKKIGINEEVIIVALDNDDKGKSLLAYVKTNLLTDEKIVKTKLGKHLPKYMIPDKIIAITEIPITLNGKVDIKALRNISLHDKKTNYDNLCRSNNIKDICNNKNILTVIEDILNISPIDTDKSFSDIGVSSIEIIRLANDLELKFKVRPSVKELMSYASINELLEFYYNELKEDIAQQKTNITFNDRMSVLSYKQVEFLNKNEYYEYKNEKSKYICKYNDRLFKNDIWNDYFDNYKELFSKISNIVGIKVYVYILKDQLENLKIGKYVFDMKEGNFYFVDTELPNVKKDNNVIISICLELGKSFENYGVEFVKKSYKNYGMVLNEVQKFIQYNYVDSQYRLLNFDIEYPIEYYHIDSFGIEDKLEKQKNKELHYKTEKLIKECSQLGIKLFCHNNQLKYKAEKGVMDKNIMIKLKENKVELLEFLKNKSDKNDFFKMTPIQKAYILGRNPNFELGNTSAHYYVEMEWNNVNVGQLEKSINSVISKNEILYTIITDNINQYVLDEIPYFKLDVKEYKSNDEFLKTRDKLSNQVFELNKWPMFYFQISILEDKRYILHFSFDCSILDGMSADLFLQELFLEYKGIDVKRPRITFKEYIEKEEDWLSKSKTYANAVKYWESRVMELPKAPNIPIIKEFSEIKKPVFNRLRYVLSREISDKLIENVKKYKMTLSAVVCSAYMCVLSQWTGEKEFTLNLTLFNRLPIHEDIEKVLGDFTNITLIPYSNKEQFDFCETTKKIQELLWEAIEYREFDGTKVLKKLLKHTPNKAIMPVVFTSMLYDNVKLDNEIKLFDEVKEVYGISQTPQVALDHQALIRDGQVILTWDYIPELYNVGELESIFKNYCLLIDELANNDDWNMHITF